MSRKRAAIAAVLAVIYPGLGHLYLRAWARAVAWFSLAVLTAALVMPESIATAFQNGGVSGVIRASSDLPFETFLALTAIRALNVIDAAWLALRRREAPGEPVAGAATCPNCGKEVDEDLDFCHWCTTRLEGPESEGAAGESVTEGGLFR